jgi:uncharacterized membrane protein
VWERLRHSVVQTLRRDFIAGLLVFVPVGFTILAVLWILQQLDSLVLPRVFRAIGMEARQPPFVGVLVTICVILLAGAATRSFLGRWALSLWERLVDRIPVARSMYSVVKQFMQAVLGEGAQASFDRVVLIEYPRKGVYSYAFVTGQMEPVDSESGPLVKVFLSSTPNPTTGYFLLVREAEVIETDLTIEEAFRVIISAGIADAKQTNIPPVHVPDDVEAS